MGLRVALVGVLCLTVLVGVGGFGLGFVFCYGGWGGLMVWWVGVVGGFWLLRFFVDVITRCWVVWFVICWCWWGVVVLGYLVVCLFVCFCLLVCLGGVGLFCCVGVCVLVCCVWCFGLGLVGFWGLVVCCCFVLGWGFVWLVLLVLI